MRGFVCLTLILFFPFFGFAQIKNFTLEIPKKKFASTTPEGVTGKAYMNFYGYKSKKIEERCDFILDKALIGTQLYGSYSGTAKSPHPSDECTQTTELNNNGDGHSETLSAKCFSVNFVKDKKEANLVCYKIETSINDGHPITSLLPLEMKRIKAMLSKVGITLSAETAGPKAKAPRQQQPEAVAPAAR